MRDQRANRPHKLDRPEAARKFFELCMAEADPAVESLWVAHLDSDARCLHLTWHRGDESGANVPIRSIIADAAMLGSRGLVMAHNHPSGDCRPSADDCRATRRLATVAEALGCRLIDHLVFGGSNCTSFKSQGLL